MPLSSPTQPLNPPLTLTPQVRHAHQTNTQSRRFNTYPKTSSSCSSKQEIASRGRYERDRSQRPLFQRTRSHGLQVRREQPHQLFIRRCQSHQCQPVARQLDQRHPCTRHPGRCGHGSLHARWLQPWRRSNTSQHSSSTAIQLQGYRKCG